MEKNLRSEKKRKRWEAEDQERDEVEDQEYEPEFEEEEEEPKKLVCNRKAEKRKTSVLQDSRKGEEEPRNKF